MVGTPKQYYKLKQIQITSNYMSVWTASTDFIFVFYYTSLSQNTKTNIKNSIRTNEPMSGKEEGDQTFIRPFY